MSVHRVWRPRCLWDDGSERVAASTCDEFVSVPADISTETAMVLFLIAQAARCRLAVSRHLTAVCLLSDSEGLGLDDADEGAHLSHQLIEDGIGVLDDV